MTLINSLTNLNKEDSRVEAVAIEREDNLMIIEEEEIGMIGTEIEIEGIGMKENAKNI